MCRARMIRHRAVCGVDFERSVIKGWYDVGAQVNMFTYPRVFLFTTLPVYLIIASSCQTHFFPSAQSLLHIRKCRKPSQKRQPWRRISKTRESKHLMVHFTMRIYGNVSAAEN